MSSSLTDAELCERARAGERDAVSALIARHYGLATKFAREFYPQPPVEMDDLVQEALMAIARAALKWEPGRGTQFNTYAVWAIKNSIIRYLEKEKKRQDRVSRATSDHDTAPVPRIPPDLEPLLSHLQSIPSIGRYLAK